MKGSVHILKPVDFLPLAEETTIIDVRAPAEYTKGHIPGAENIPLFNDKERAEVGTLYKQVGQEQAMEKGLELVGQKMVTLTRDFKSKIKGRKVGVHCWRGGMRSQSVAQMLQFFGYEVYVLRGGYKAYRSLLLHTLQEEGKLIVLGGFTGSEKTEILHGLKSAGEQVIDLEGLARHKGSAFGDMEQLAQPSSEQFANDLFAQWQQMNPKAPIWVEDESRGIGQVFMPDELYHRMQRSPLIFIESPKNRRIRHLADLYGQMDKGHIKSSLRKITKRLGGQHVKAAEEAIRQNNAEQFLDIVLTYYDKAYQNALRKREVAPALHLAVGEKSREKIVQELVRCKKELEKDGKHKTYAI